MTNKHTPGPWYVDPKYLSEIQTKDDQTICSAWHKHASGQEIVVTGVLECSLEESAANARLISAAPDLLAALKGARELVEYGGFDLTTIDAAISKAEGA